MADYGFAKELFLIGNGKPLPLSFFDKMEALVKDNIRRYSPRRVNPRWQHWKPEHCKEIALDFILDHLFKKGNERIRFFLDSGGECYFPDGLMVQMFRQYMTFLIGRSDPAGLNLFRRIKGKLKKMVKEGCVETKGSYNSTAFRRTGDKNDNFVESDELEAAASLLPAWQSFRYKADSKKIDPVIGNVDLETQLTAVFSVVSGWISLEVLLDFLLPRFNSNGFVVEKLMADTPSLSIYQPGVGDDPEMKLQIQEIVENQLTERQRAIFNYHYINGCGVPEIVSLTGLKKSTIYNEITKIEDIFETNLRRRRSC